MKKRLFNFIYYLIIICILYFPIVIYMKGLNIRHLFTNNNLIISIMVTVVISLIVALLTNILGVFISRYIYRKKQQLYYLMSFPIMVGIIVYLINLVIHMNNYVLLVLLYTLFLTPIVTYLDYYSIDNITKNKKDVLKSFGKVEYIRLLDSQILINYFIVFLIVYSDHLISSLVFNNNVKLLSCYIRELVIINDYTNIANACILSFLIVVIILIILYMINYELKLRSRYEKDN